MEETVKANQTLGDAREMFFAIDIALRLRDEILMNSGSSIPMFDNKFPIPDSWSERFPLIDTLLSRFSLAEMRALICNWIEDYYPERGWDCEFNRSTEEILDQKHFTILSEFLEAIFGEEGELSNAVDWYEGG